MDTRGYFVGLATTVAVLMGLAIPVAAQAQQLPRAQVQFFTHVDADKDGVITASEYAAYRDAQMARHDGDKDGIVSREEFVAGAPGRGAEARFKALDKDGDGKVTKAEWGAETEKLFQTRDADKDGKLTPDEMGPLRAMRKGP